MKRNISLFLMLSIFFTFIGAQQRLIIKLTDGTTIEKEIWEVQNITFKSSPSVEIPITAVAVDLGLGVKWANFNFGATKPEESGYFIGWGDVTGNNYSTNLSYFPTANPNTNIINGEYDIVHQMWGSDWRYPSVQEFQELIDSCTWTYDEAKIGYTITSRKSANSIFLPISGFRNGKDTLDVNKHGIYWSGTLSSDHTKASAILVGNSSVRSTDTLRYIGCSIRPVFGKYLYGAVISSDSTSNVTSSSAIINVSFDGDFTHGTSFGICYSTEANVNPDSGTNVTTTEIESNGRQTFTLSNLKPNTTYYYVAYITYNNNRILGNLHSFTTLKKFPVATAVDLGLSVKWANWNIGATKESDFGSYIAWGDPTGENQSFLNSDYPDGSNIGGTKYDVATVQWGGKWRMPTASELLELGQLSKERIQKDGVYGLQVTASNGNQIFLPQGGYENKTGFWGSNEQAYYWSSDLASVDFAKSCTMGIVSGSIAEDYKVLHMLIRPVYDENNSSDPGAVTPIDTTAAGRAASSVDLGLSVKWATYNLGATQSTDYGDYYAWGETSPKTDYSLTSYKYYSAVTNSYSDIGADIKNTEYDAARAQWGGTWRMPTFDEFTELTRKCTWVWSDTKIGYTVTSSNGNSIFLPASGKIVDSTLSLDGQQGHYWTSNVDDLIIHVNDHWSYKLNFTDSHPYSNGHEYRYSGLTIRPVRP